MQLILVCKKTVSEKPMILPSVMQVYFDLKIVHTVEDIVISYLVKIHSRRMSRLKIFKLKNDVRIMKSSA